MKIKNNAKNGFKVSTKLKAGLDCKGGKVAASSNGGSCVCYSDNQIQSHLDSGNTIEYC